MYEKKIIFVANLVRICQMAQYVYKWVYFKTNVYIGCATAKL